MIFSLQELLPRMDELTDKSTSCWLWQGRKDAAGYGVIDFLGRPSRVHRLSAALFLGLDLDDGREQQALHKCKCKACWNPEHLYVGTHSNNMRDSIPDRYNPGRVRKTHCWRGHELTPENSYWSGGTRSCRACRKQVSIDWNKKIREARHV